MQNNSTGFLNSIPPVTLNLIIINLLMLLASNVLPGIGIYLDNYLALYSLNAHYFQPIHFQPHQLITYMFMHGGFMHLFFNMFAVFMFGRILETVWGAKKFLSFYLLTGIGAGLAQLLVSYLTGNPSITVGASGAVFGILVAFGMMFPDAKLMLLFPPIPIKAKWFVIGYGVVELFLGVSGFEPGVAHFAHLGGAVVGLIIVLIWRRKAKKNGRWDY